MNQHPVPQNITSYQFRLVGEMTLKQFLELAAGVVLAYLFFVLKIPAFIKLPLAVFFALFGFALAFLPIEERPLDKWIVNFIKSVYSPTRYLWQKRNLAPLYLQPSPLKTNALRKNPIIYFTRSQATLHEYLGTMPQPKISTSLDLEESKKLELINKLLTGEQNIAPLPSAAAAPPLTPAIPQPGPIIQKAKPLAPPLSVETLFPVQQKLRPSVQAVFSNLLSGPIAPDVPNIIVGSVLTTTNKILPNTLIEVQDMSGNTIRALKTNKLGQFFTASPLENGNYKIKVENDNFEFAIIDLEVRGKIIPPLKIKAIKELNHAML